MPQDWLRDAVSSGLSPGSLHQFVSKSAQVSLVAAAINLVQALPPGHLFAMVDKLGFVQYSGTSQGTSVSAPAVREHLDVDLYSKKCTLHETVSGRSGTATHWWKYGAVKAVPASDDARSGSEILRSMVRDTVSSPEQAKFFTQSIAGIIGSANSTRQAATVDELLGVLHQTFLVRPPLAAIMRHPDFDAFLTKKAVEIVSGRGNAKPKSKTRNPRS